MASPALATHLFLTGHSQEAMDMAEKASCWNSYLAAAAPSQGYKPWAAAMRARASRLSTGGHTHWSACHLLAIGEVWQAIQVYMQHGMHREALALARCRLDVRDPAFGSLLQQLLQQLLQPAPSHPQQQQGHVLAEQQQQHKPQPTTQQESLPQMQLPGHVAAAPLAAPDAVACLQVPRKSNPPGSVPAPQVAAPPAAADTPLGGGAPTEPTGAGATMRTPGAASTSQSTSHVTAAVVPPPRRVPAEALALQGLIAGQPLLAARALRAAGTASALAAAAQLCARVVGSLDPSGGGRQGQQQQQQQALRDLGRECAADALPALFREAQRVLAAAAATALSPGGQAPAATAAATASPATAAVAVAPEAAVEVSCRQVQFAAAAWGGASLAGSHCAAALLSWSLRQLPLLAAPLGPYHPSGGGGVGGSSQANGRGHGDCGLGDEGHGGSGMAPEADARLGQGCEAAADKAAVAGKAAGGEHDTASCEVGGVEGAEYDDDDEMALLAVHAVYLGRGPLAAGGGGGSGDPRAPRWKVLAARRSPPTAAATSAPATVAMAEQSVDQAAKGLSIRVEGGSCAEGPGAGPLQLITAADAAAAASAMWVAACATCGVRGDDPAVVNEARAGLQAAVAAAAAASATEAASARGRCGWEREGGECGSLRPPSAGEREGTEGSGGSAAATDGEAAATTAAPGSASVEGPGAAPAAGSVPGEAASEPAAEGQRHHHQHNHQHNQHHEELKAQQGQQPVVHERQKRREPKQRFGKSGGGCVADVAALTATAETAVAELQLSVCSLAAAAIVHALLAGAAGGGACAASGDGGLADVGCETSALQQAADALLLAARRCAALLPPPHPRAADAPSSVAHAPVRSQSHPHHHHHHHHNHNHEHQHPLRHGGGRVEPSTSVPAPEEAGQVQKLRPPRQAVGGQAIAATRAERPRWGPACADDPDSPWHAMWVIEQQQQQLAEGRGCVDGGAGAGRQRRPNHIAAEGACLVDVRSGAHTAGVEAAAAGIAAALGRPAAPGNVPGRLHYSPTELLQVRWRVLTGGALYGSPTAELAQRILAAGLLPRDPHSSLEVAGP